MNPLIQLRKAIFVFFVALTCFGLPPAAQTQLPSPTPDGFYPGGNTAEAKDALIHVDVQTGQFNTRLGSKHSSQTISPVLLEMATMRLDSRRIGRRSQCASR